MMMNKLIKKEEEIVDRLDKVQRKRVFSLKGKGPCMQLSLSHWTSNQFHQIPISVLNNFANSKEMIVVAGSEKSGSWGNLWPQKLLFLHCVVSWSCAVTVADQRKAVT